MTRSRLPDHLLEAGLVVAWSSGFIGARLAADTPSVFLVLFWRFVIVTLLLSPFVLRACRRSLGRRQIALQASLGTLAMFAYLAFGTKSIDLGVPAGTAALICALQPLATAALAGPVLGEAVRWRQWVGLVAGLVGVGLAVGGSVGPAPLWAYGFCALGMAGLVVATLLAKVCKSATALLPALGIQSAVTAVLFAPLVVAEGGIAPLLDAEFLAAVAWFVLLSTVGGYGLYWLCLQRSTATRVGSLIYLTPPVTMLWAWAMFGEPLAPGAAVGFTLCLVGVVLARETRAGRGAPDRVIGLHGALTPVASVTAASSPASGKEVVAVPPSAVR